MGARHLIDSNVIIDYAANRLTDEANKYVENLFNNDFIISVVTLIEVLGYNDLPGKIKELEMFLNESYVFQLEQNIIQETILIRRNHKIKLGDAIIAATAITHGLIVMTRNTKDFEKIVAIKTINPYDL